MLDHEFKITEIIINLSTFIKNVSVYQFISTRLNNMYIVHTMYTIGI